MYRTLFQSMMYYHTDDFGNEYFWHDPYGIYDALWGSVDELGM